LYLIYLQTAVTYNLFSEIICCHKFVHMPLIKNMLPGKVLNILETITTNTVLIHQLFEAQVIETPNRIAIEFAEEQLTYQQLNERANQLAHHLQTLGVEADALVGICVERSPQLIIAILATLKAGGAYLPLDPNYPTERLAFMLANSQTSVVLTQSNLSHSLPLQTPHCLCLDEENLARYPTTNPETHTTPDNLAYLIYTSGSTGQPKGVAMPHRPLVNLICWQSQTSTIDSHSRTLQYTPISFDVSFQETFATLSTGGTLVLISDRTRRNPSSFLPFLQQQSINRLFLPFVALQQLAEIVQLEGVIPSSLQEVITAGEQLRITEAIAYLFTHLPNCTLHNHYGPSETHVVTAYTLTGIPQNWAVLPPIGQPITNSQIYLLDAELQPVDVGMLGELYVGGVSLARGYLHRPDLTSQRFIVGASQERLYKTGDLARYLADGNLEYCGRIDEQVKIRGYRIEPGEIEAVLEGHSWVHQAIVVARGDIGGDRSLVAYLLVDAAITEGELRQFLGLHLPEYMIPSAFVVLAQFPLTPSGKIDRHALPAPSFPTNQENWVSPQTPIQIALADIWTDILGIPQISIYDNFFDLGGHSLLVTKVITRIRDVFQVELPLNTLFESTAIAQLAECVAALPQIPTIRLPRNPHLPLSFVQEQLWFLDQFVPDHPFYNVPEAFRLQGSLNTTHLEQAFQTLIQRHEALRTTFTTVDGNPIQVIHPAFDFKLSVVELEELTLPERESKTWQFILAEAQKPFNLSQTPLLRVKLYKLSPEEHILFLNLHHIICDEWSIGILLEELSQLYTGNSLPDLPIQYADYANWQRHWLQGEIRASQLAYWQNQLQDLPSALQLPSDRPHPTVPTYQGARQSLNLPLSLSEKLKELSHQAGVTMFVTMLTAFQTLLYLYTKQEDILVGSPIANRHHPQIENVIGFCVNTVVLRSNLSGNPSFRELLNRVREVTLGAYAHQDLPFEQVIQAIQPERNINQNPLFQVLFDFQNEPIHTSEFPNLSLTRLLVDNHTAKFDLFLELIDTTNGITGFFEYSTDLFDASTITRLSGHFQTLLERIVDHPEAQIGSLLTEIKPNAKVNDHPLPTPQHSRTKLQVKFVPPKTKLEKLLASLWTENLGVTKIGIHDSFLELGGYSLKAVQLVAKIKETFKINLPLRHFFEAPNIAQLAKLIAEQQAETSVVSLINPVIDLNAEAVLDVAINPQAASTELLEEPTNILLTGGTGFLGGFLLHQLLRETSANIYCLVRAESLSAGFSRLQNNLAQYSLWDENNSDRIIPLIGDLAQPLLGLSANEFQNLATKIDVIYHNGGLVNFVYPYSVLKAPNVLGTQEILRLASQTKVKPVHFISTVGVFSPIAYPETEVILEQEANRHQGLYGYTQSKWVAEKLVNIAQQRGIPTNIYRPTWIEGDSQTGICNQPDFLRSLIKGCIQLGLAPDWQMLVDIIPVDYISQAIVYLSRNKSLDQRIFHLSNPHAISWNQLVIWIQRFGYPLQQIPFEDWLSKVMFLVPNYPENALYPFLNFLSDKVSEQHSVPELYFQSKTVKFDCQNTLDGLRDTNIICPPVNDQLLNTYFSYFIQSSFLEPN
jgi:amino acid adenylation domain-containing protein/thioester reductase-like protein